MPPVFPPNRPDQHALTRRRIISVVANDREQVSSRSPVPAAAPLGRVRPRELFARLSGRVAIKPPGNDPLSVGSAHLHPAADPATEFIGIRAMPAAMKGGLDEINWRSDAGNLVPAVAPPEQAKERDNVPTGKPEHTAGGATEAIGWSAVEEGHRIPVEAARAIIEVQLRWAPNGRPNHKRHVHAAEGWPDALGCARPRG